MDRAWCWGQTPSLGEQAAQGQTVQSSMLRDSQEACTLLLDHTLGALSLPGSALLSPHPQLHLVCLSLMQHPVCPPTLSSTLSI